MAADRADMGHSQRLWAAGILLAAWALLVLALPAKSLWLDEMLTLNFSSPAMGILDLGHVVDAIPRYHELRPPAYYLFVHAWTFVMSDSEMALRLPSTFAALLAVALMIPLVRQAGMASLGVLPAALLALSPTFILYGRMARAYSMATAVGILNTIVFLRLLTRPSRRAWLAYVLSGILLVYTDYALFSLLVAQNSYIVYRAIRGQRSLPVWLAAQAIVVIAFLPWLPVLSVQAQTERLAADLSTSVVGPLMRGAYLAYSLCVGETIFPWHPLAIVGLLAAGCLGFLAVAQAGRRSRSPDDHLLGAIVFLVVPILVMSAVFTAFVPSISFVYVASRLLFLVPFFVLLLAAGWQAIGSMRRRGLALAALALAWAASLSHYYGNRDFHNPVYIMPLREATAHLAQDMQPADIVLYEYEAPLLYYVKREPRWPASVALYLQRGTGDLMTAAQKAIADRQSTRVWLITLGRDSTRTTAPGEQLAAWVSQTHVLAETRGYARQDPLYRRVKELILGRPDYEYKLLIRLYTRL